MGGTRQDDRAKTKNSLAGRAGFICSFPECSQLTIRPDTCRHDRLVDRLTLGEISRGSGMTIALSWMKLVGGFFRFLAPAPEDIGPVLADRG